MPLVLQLGQVTIIFCPGVPVTFIVWLHSGHAIFFSTIYSCASFGTW